jgi:hypothetical protein
MKCEYDRRDKTEVSSRSTSLTELKVPNVVQIQDRPPEKPVAIKQPPKQSKPKVKKSQKEKPAPPKVNRLL